MKKPRLLALILLLSVVLMGVGYAYWNETVTISSTITTGELNVEFLSIADYAIPNPYIDLNDEYDNTLEFPESRLAPFDISEDKHTLTAGFRDVFPGMFYSIPFGMENKGTIPAVFKSCTITSDIDDSTLNGLNESYLRSELNRNLWINNMIFKVYKDSNSAPTQIIPFINGTSIPLGQLEDTLNNFLSTHAIRLEPGDHLQLTSNEAKIMGGSIKFLFTKDFTNDFQSKRFHVNINTQWKQFNETN